MTHASTSPIKVDIWSDVQCPWCYIGKRKFEAGAAAFGGVVEIEYHSFELAPDTPVDFDTLEDNAVTGRERDSMAQERISLDRVVAYLAEQLVGA